VLKNTNIEQMKYFYLLLLLSISSSLWAQKDKSTFKKLDRSLKLIETQYVDTIDAAAITTAAVKAMIKQLDPHSKYLSKSSLQKSNEMINSSFAGIGIRFQILNDTLIILNAVKEGPCDKAGLQAGDKLITINGESVVGKAISNQFFSKRLRGKIGSPVKLTIMRHSDHSIHSYTIKRGQIPINTIVSNYLINRNTAYIKISSFSRSTNLEFQIAAMQLQMSGIKNIIIDLRGNPGGLMISSIRLADSFLDDGKLIVFTQGAHSQRTEYKATAGGQMDKARLIILIDENSASASEIFAGAMQDWDRGLVVGRRSFGKGLVGRNYRLPDGSAIRLTTGHYYTPSGRCIQKSYSKGTQLYNQDLALRYKHGELYTADSIHFPDSMKYYTHDKRLVYGGGGIMPDIFIPLDTSYQSPYLNKLSRYGVINYFTGLYFDKHLEHLKKQYPNYSSFRNHFHPDKKDLKAIEDLALVKYKIKPNGKYINKSKLYILNNFKALLARDLYSNGTYYEQSNNLDKMVQTAGKLFKTNTVFKAHGIHN